MQIISNFSIKGVAKWIPFFSQTGTEILNIINETGIEPDVIVTNIKLEDINKINKQLFESYYDKFIFLPPKPTPEEYQTVLGENKGVLVTLHGWLRIIPSEICNKYHIYNGHPGLITEYPELKGKDPQIRAYLGNYESGGSVIHKVTPGVDEGPVLITEEVLIKGLDLNDTFNILSSTSLQSWVKFFNKVKWLKE